MNLHMLPILILCVLSFPLRLNRFHPVLDDPFFSIHDFNRETEELEAFEVSNGKLGLDDDEDEEDEDEDDDDDLEGLMSGAGGNKVDMWANVEAANDVGTDGTSCFTSFSFVVAFVLLLSWCCHLPCRNVKKTSYVAVQME